MWNSQTQAGGPSLPGAGKFGGRKRNTAANIQSNHQTMYGGFTPGGDTSPGLPGLPPGTPSEAASYYQQLAGLSAQYMTAVQAAKLQRVGARADFRQAMAGAHADLLQGMSAAENQGIESGVLGGSADLGRRIAVQGAAAGERVAAHTALQQGMGQADLSVMQARSQYMLGKGGIDMSYAAAQESQAAQAKALALQTSQTNAAIDALMKLMQKQTQPGMPAGPHNPVTGALWGPAYGWANGQYNTPGR